MALVVGHDGTSLWRQSEVLSLRESRVLIPSYLSETPAAGDGKSRSGFTTRRHLCGDVTCMYDSGICACTLERNLFDSRANDSRECATQLFWFSRHILGA